MNHEELRELEREVSKAGPDASLRHGDPVTVGRLEEIVSSYPELISSYPVQKVGPIADAYLQRAKRRTLAVQLFGQLAPVSDLVRVFKSIPAAAKEPRGCNLTGATRSA